MKKTQKKLALFPLASIFNSQFPILRYDKRNCRSYWQSIKSFRRRSDYWGCSYGKLTISDYLIEYKFEFDLKYYNFNHYLPLTLNSILIHDFLFLHHYYYFSAWWWEESIKKLLEYYFMVDGKFEEVVWCPSRVESRVASYIEANQPVLDLDICGSSGYAIDRIFETQLLWRRGFDSHQDIKMLLIWSTMLMSIQGVVWTISRIEHKI